MQIRLCVLGYVSITVSYTHLDVYKRQVSTIDVQTCKWFTSLQVVYITSG